MNIETANRLLQYRKKMNLSQEELASRIGVSRQAVSKWERHRPTRIILFFLPISTVFRLMNCLKAKKKPKAKHSRKNPKIMPKIIPTATQHTKNQTRFRSNTESMLTQRTVILFTLISGTESMLKIKTVQRLMSVGMGFMLKKTAKQKSIQTKTEMLCMMKALKSINIQSCTAFGNTFRFG